MILKKARGKYFVRLVSTRGFHFTRLFFCAPPLFVVVFGVPVTVTMWGIEVMGSKIHLEPDSWLEALHEIMVGTFTGSTRAFYIMSTWIYVNIVRPLAKAVGINVSAGKKEKTPGGKMKVAAVGFGRTGTVRQSLNSTADRHGATVRKN